MRLRHWCAVFMALLALGFLSQGAEAQQSVKPCLPVVSTASGVTVTSCQDVGPSNPLPVGASKHTVSSTLTRIANTTAYTGTATSPQAICLFTSVTICAPPTLTFTNQAVNGYVTSLRLEKSTTGATGATFAVLLYQTAPTLTGIFDASVYTPVSADVTSGGLVGYWSCPTEVVNGANATYECVSTTGSGNQAFSTGNGTLYAVVLTTGSYAPGSGETFNVIADILASSP